MINTNESHHHPVALPELQSRMAPAHPQGARVLPEVRLSQMEQTEEDEMTTPNAISLLYKCREFIVNCDLHREIDRQRQEVVGKELLEFLGPEDKPNHSNTSNWRPIAECDLKPSEPFWGWQPGALVATLFRYGVNERDLNNLHVILTHFMRCEGIYQIPPAPTPKTQQELDEEAMIAARKLNSVVGVDERKSIGWEFGWRAAITHARKESGK